MTPNVDSTPESGLWKDYLNPARLKKFAQVLHSAYDKFDTKAFLADIEQTNVYDRELKDRINTIATILTKYLPSSYGSAVNIFRKVAPQFGGFDNWVLMSYVEQFGLEHFEESVRAMHDLTRYSTAEFCIRPYMNRYTDKMLPILHTWAEDPDEHVRRLAAEGSRPRGVWTAHIESFKKDPSPVLELLEKLKADESLYVRKAVANNLNDISKDHPGAVIKTALTWQKDGNKHTDWIIRHACRSLIKKGDPRVFPLFGFTRSPRLDVKSPALSPRNVKIGQEAELSFELVSTAKKNQKLAIDYKVYYVVKSGNHSAKVFKLAEKTLNPQETQRISTRHSFANNSTRTHYPGKHKIEIVINGVVHGSVAFNLK